MTTTYTLARQAVARFSGMLHTGTVTTALAASTALVDTALEDEYYNDDDLNGYWAHITSEDNAGEQRVIEDHTGAGSILAVHGAIFATDGSDKATYEITNFKPDRIKEALNDAMSDQFDRIWQEIDDTTLFTSISGNQTMFTRPSDITEVFNISIEEPLNPNFEENILYQEGFDVEFESLDTTSVTNTNVTCAVYGVTDQKKQFVPSQYGNYVLQVISDSSAGSRSYEFSNPAYYKGQKLTMVMPVYCETADEFTIKITDNAGSTSSSAHGGTGWEFLSVTHSVDDECSSLIISIETAGNTVTGYVAQMILTRTEFRVENLWRKIGDWIDYSGEIRFNRKLPAGRFLRVTGKKKLTNFSGATFAVLEASTTELNDPQTEILYYAATLKLFEELDRKTLTHADSPYGDIIDGLRNHLAWARRQYGMIHLPVKRSLVM